jgi:hypothetical protein
VSGPPKPLHFSSAEGRFEEEGLFALKLSKREMKSSSAATSETNAKTVTHLVR